MPIWILVLLIQPHRIKFAEAFCALEQSRPTRGLWWGLPACRGRSGLLHTLADLSEGAGP